MRLCIEAAKRDNRIENWMCHHDDCRCGDCVPVENGTAGVPVFRYVEKPK